MKREFTVSTDIGLFCTPGEISRLYGRGVKNVEVIGWRWAERFFLKPASENGLKIWRLHGRMGPTEQRGRAKARMDLLNSMLVPTAELLRLAKKYRVNRILLHVNKVKSVWKEAVNLPKEMELSIENSLGNGAGLEGAFQTAAKLKTLGVKVKVVGDVGHFGLETERLIWAEETMKLFLERIDGYEKSYGVKSGAHLPINDEIDKGAINLDRISDETLRRFLQRFDDLVVENQLGSAFGKKSRKRWERILKLGQA